MSSSRLQNQARHAGEAAFRANRMSGEHAPFNDYSSWVKDSRNGKLYMYGGVRPADKSGSPTSDFYRCDLPTMKWTNLTKSLRFIPNRHDPFQEPGSKKQELPALKLPASALARLNGQPFVFLFGGYDAKKDCVVNDLIAIDVDHLQWWYVKVEGGLVRDRVGATMVSVDQRLYIFGGFTPFEDAAPVLKSYSIAEYSRDRGGWIWISCDTPLEDRFPSFGRDPQAVPVYKGKKILIIPGRSSRKEKIQIPENHLMFFDTEHLRPQFLPEPAGTFPRDISWMSVNLLEPLATKQAVVPTPSHTRNRAKKHRAHMSFEVLRAAASTSSPIRQPSESVVFCAWSARGEFLTPEIWRYRLTPDDQIDCLGLEQRIWDMNSDFQFSTTYGNNAILFGTDVHSPDEVEGGTSNHGSSANAVWNIYTKIPVTGPS